MCFSYNILLHRTHSLYSSIAIEPEKKCALVPRVTGFEYHYFFIIIISLSYLIVTAII